MNIFFCFFIFFSYIILYRGRLYSELFEDLPDRSEYPEYYKTIKNPRSLSEIAEKMQTRSYPNLHSWMNDMKLVFENALSFNEPGSRIFRDAKLLMVKKTHKKRHVPYKSLNSYFI